MSEWRQYRKTALARMCYIEDGPALLDALDAAPATLKAVDCGHKAQMYTQENWVETPYPFWLAIDAEGFPYPVSPNNHASSYEDAGPLPSQDLGEPADE